MRAALAMALLLLGAGPAAAQVRPAPGFGDPHLQTIDYQADQVTLLETAPGYQLTVALGADEQVESVAVGDSASWQISAGHGGDHLFIKALQADASTNMTVITSARVYAFDLVALAGPSPTMPYTVAFRYATDAQAPPGGPTITPGPIVGRYELHGDHALRPIAIVDDGVHTYIEWSRGSGLPATYVRDNNGVETLANGEMRGGVYVVDSIHDELIFRIDKDKASADRVVTNKRP